MTKRLDPGTGASDPLTRLLDLISRRHTAAIIRELTAGAVRFTDLGARLSAAAPQLSQRLRELREAGVVEVDEAGDYRLTVHGRRLLGPLTALEGFAVEWAALSARQRQPRGAATAGSGECP